MNWVKLNFNFGKAMSKKKGARLAISASVSALRVDRTASIMTSCFEKGFIDRLLRMCGF